MWRLEYVLVLLALEVRFAFFHKCCAAFFVVVAVKTGVIDALAKVEVALIGVFANFCDDLFAGFDGQGCVARNGFCIVVYECV